MIAKAFVLNKHITENKWKVRIPILHSVGSDNKCTPDDNLPYATLCTNVKSANPFTPGDIVFVDFENNDISRPVILGKLDVDKYTDNFDNVYSDDRIRNKYEDVNRDGALLVDSISVDSIASLPRETNIGSITYKEIECIKGIKDNIQNQIDGLSDKYVTAYNKNQDIYGLKTFHNDVMLSVYSTGETPRLILQRKELGDLNNDYEIYGSKLYLEVDRWYNNAHHKLAQFGRETTTIYSDNTVVNKIKIGNTELDEATLIALKNLLR